MTSFQTQTSLRAGTVRYRFIVVTIAVLAAIAVWVVAALLGIPLAVTSPLAGTVTIGLLLVIATALPAALAGWLTLTVLERVSRHARRIWTVIAVVVLAVSLLALPFLHATLASMLALGVMHLAAALPLIVFLPRGTALRQPRGSADTR